MEEKIGRIKDLISKEKYEDVKTWLKENIHKYGSIYSPQNLIKKALGEGINTTYFINHIKNKIKELY